ncbi:hypothetical protein ACFQMA_07960 [Halosimplex aquaticum]|uniref:Uncharacterized protein n=1 Tax=Halosimplex aquaticum TaxID=3026162 RepID=A0ABD5XYQ1_9EURY|nr:MULTISPECIES: hypothetical protein [Halosimplex]
MSEKTAELWARAEDCHESPADIEAALEELNRDLDWDRENLIAESVSQRESVLADD